jgi:5-formyltetrahydrofolate cyclo-ligase
MTKAQLRSIYKEKRKLISPQQKTKWTDLLLINFQKIDLPFVTCVHTYLAMYDHNEIPTQQIIGYLKFRNPGLQVSIPKVNTETGQIEHFIYKEDMVMVINKFGVKEPSDGDKIDATDIDVVLTPLLAFDKKGNRVGFGKGYYDRFFSQCRGDVLKIGLSFFEAEEIIEDASQYDIPLNFCVTPQTVYRF